MKRVLTAVLSALLFSSTAAAAGDAPEEDAGTFPAEPTWAEKHDEEFLFDEEGDGVERLPIPPYYSEKRGDISTRLFFPFYWEQWRTGDNWFRSLGILPFYWMERDAEGFKADAVLPFFGRWLSSESRTHLVLNTYYTDTDTGYYFGTAPFVFLGRDGEENYQIIPPLIWRFADKDFDLTLTLPFYYHHYRGDDYDWGVPPLIFSGLKRDDLYTIVFPFYWRFANQNLGEDLHVLPLFLNFFKERETGYSYGFVPLLYFARDKEWDRTMVLPFYYGSRWGPGYSHYFLPFLSWTRQAPWLDQGGVILYHWAYERGDYFHTFLPLWFDWGNTDTREKNYIVPPLLFYYGHSPVGNGHVVGPWIYFHEEHKSLTHALFPLYYQSEHLYENHFDTVVLNIHYGETPHGWLFNLYPLLFLSEDEKTQKSHYIFAPLVWRFEDWEDINTVVFPFWWQFDKYKRQDTASVFFPLVWDFNDKLRLERATVVFPFYWDFSYKREGESDIVVFPFYWQFHEPDAKFTLVLNTAYRSGKHKSGDEYWSLHFFPLFRFGEPVPGGADFSFLYGLFEYTRQGSYSRMKLFWIPFDL